MKSFQPSYSSFQPHDRLFGDEALQRRIVSFLVTHAGVAVDQVRLSVSAGRITLRGEVKSPVARQLVHSCCSRVAGVLDVRSEIRVVNRPRSSAWRTRAGRGRFLPARSNPVVVPEFAPL
jgi:hypothetical protein